MPLRSSRVTGILAAAVVLLLATVASLSHRVEPPAAPPASAPASVATRSGTVGPAVPPSAAAPGDSRKNSPSADAAPQASDASSGSGDSPPLPDYTPWAAVDMDEIRAALPDNVYWKMSFPTKDPAVLREREEERERWNTEYGKVLSNTATDEEIDAYYARRERVSRDYAEFAGLLLAKYSTTLPKRDAAMLKLALELNLARLEEIPRRIAEAHDRRRAHEAARRAWLEDQKAFEGDPAGAP